MSTDILFENNNIFNGDDCVVIGSPSSNIHFRNSYCSGSHGLSVSPLGMGGTASSMQNILYVVHTLVRLGSLISPSKVRKCYHGRVDCDGGFRARD